MAKHDKDRKKHKPDAVAGQLDQADHTDPPASGGHHAAKAHGRPATVDASLPGTREELLARHTEARKRRNAAPLDSGLLVVSK